MLADTNVDAAKMKQGYPLRGAGGDGEELDISEIQNNKPDQKDPDQQVMDVSVPTIKKIDDDSLMADDGMFDVNTIEKKRDMTLKMTEMDDFDEDDKDDDSANGSPTKPGKKNVNFPNPHQNYDPGEFMNLTKQKKEEVADEFDEDEDKDGEEGAKEGGP
jgi:hypothetical protein